MLFCFRLQHKIITWANPCSFMDGNKLLYKSSVHSVSSAHKKEPDWTGFTSLKRTNDSWQKDGIQFWQGSTGTRQRHKNRWSSSRLYHRLSLKVLSLELSSLGFPGLTAVTRCSNSPNSPSTLQPHSHSLPRRASVAPNPDLISCVHNRMFCRNWQSFPKWMHLLQSCYNVLYVLKAHRDNILWPKVSKQFNNIRHWCGNGFSAHVFHYSDTTPDCVSTFATTTVITKLRDVKSGKMHYGDKADC